MSNVTFTIGTNRTCRFTSSQVEKVNQAIEILDKVWGSTNFKKAITGFSWTSENGTTFDRFHMSGGMSNDQVWSCISNATNTPTNKSKSKVNISVVPCANANDYNWCVNNGMPCVGVNVNYINCEWYTPVHIACAIMYDYCVNCCGFTGYTNAHMVNCWNSTVPAACCTIVRDCAMKVGKDVNVGQWTAYVNNGTFNCFPCCTTWGTTWNTNTGITAYDNTCVKVNEAICAMQNEIDCLNSIRNKSTDEVNRLTMMMNAVETMNTVCQNMWSTSLDGCETAWMPMGTTKNVVTG